ncbi:MAG: hypothetical protein EOO27_27725 [Comamonadaceae bacterium]|nr:MAG: hypothetical protein EOO27_27725 [Comamonadaceae bacterium]
MRATKALPRAKAAPSPAPLAAPAVDANEQAIAATGASLLGQAAQCIHAESGTVYAGTLLELGQKLLQQAAAGNVTMGSMQEVFYFAAGTCTGALAIEQRDFPEALHRHHLISTAVELLNNAGLSYDCEINANAVAAAAVEAGARQYRDRSAPPIRRAEREGYTPEQMRAVLEFVACKASTLEDLLIVAAETTSVGPTLTLIHSAQNLTQFIGAASDRAAGEGVLGDFEDWAHGPNFPRKGGAA